jgi:hypothetical protein
MQVIRKVLSWLSSTPAKSILCPTVRLSLMCLEERTMLSAAPLSLVTPASERVLVGMLLPAEQKSAGDSAGATHAADKARRNDIHFSTAPQSEGTAGLDLSAPNGATGDFKIATLVGRKAGGTQQDD